MTLDNYEFTVAATHVQTLPDKAFKASTVINFPKVTAPVFDTAAYETMTDEQKAAYSADYVNKMNLYKTRGDDGNFNSFCYPLTVTAESKSMATMRFSYEVKASASVSSAVNVSSALRWFVFDKEASQRLAAGGASQGDYALELHAACDSAAEGNVTDLTSLLALNESRLLEGRRKSLDSLSKDVYYYGERASVAIVCWLDYTKVREILYDVNGGVDMGAPDDNPVGAYRSFSLNITVSVTAENTPLPEGAV